MVHRVRPTLSDRPVALKILYPQLVVDPATVGLFRQEAGTMAHLDHPHINSLAPAHSPRRARGIVIFNLEPEPE